MASFKASHPKRHDLTLACMGGEGRSLDVRAHLKGPWRRVVKKINASSSPGKEIAGLKKQDDEDEDEDEDDDARIAKFVCVEFSYEALKVRRGPLGLCIGTYGPMECSGEFLKPP